MRHPFVVVCGGLFLALAAPSCGARTSLDVSQERSAATAAPPCLADGSACTSGSDCCSQVCTAGRCGASPCHPGDPPTLLATVAPSAAGWLDVPLQPQIALSATDVIFNTPDDAATGQAKLLAVPKAGGPARVLYAGTSGPGQPTVAGASVFFYGDGLMQVPVGGGAISNVLAAPAAGYDLATGDGNLYFLTVSNELMELVAASGAPVPVTRTGAEATGFGGVTQVCGLVVGGGNAAWNAPGPLLSTVITVTSLSTGATQTLGSALCPTVEAVDSSYVYAVLNTCEAPWGSVTFARFPIAGGDPQPFGGPFGNSEPFASLFGCAGPFQLVATDPNFIYFPGPAEEDAGPGDWTLWAAPSGGGSPQPVDTGGPNPAAVVTDDSCIYTLAGLPGVTTDEDDLIEWGIRKTPLVSP